MECTPGSEIIGSHQTRVTEGYKLPYVCCKSNPSPLEGQKVVLTAEPSLMPPKLGLFIPISDTYIKCFGLYLFLLLLNINISPPWGLLFVCFLLFSLMHSYFLPDFTYEGKRMVSAFLSLVFYLHNDIYHFPTIFLHII